MLNQDRIKRISLSAAIVSIEQLIKARGGTIPKLKLKSTDVSGSSTTTTAWNTGTMDFV
jgi:hypothetical protein